MWASWKGKTCFRYAQRVKEIIPSIPYTVFSYRVAGGGAGVLGAEYLCHQRGWYFTRRKGLTVENYAATCPVYGEGLCPERFDGSKSVGILANDESREE